MKILIQFLNSLNCLHPWCCEVMGWVCRLPTQLCFCVKTYRILRAAILLCLLLFYCEYLHYYMVLIQCTWPKLEKSSGGIGQSEPLKVMILADTHLLGSEGHWFDRLRREWQMERAFQTSMFLHSPEAVFVLGDLLDDGKWCSDSEFQYQVDHFNRMFATPSSTHLYALVGNHDIGFHYMMTERKHERFAKAFKSPSVQLIQIKGNVFVLVNSMAMEGDDCSLCHDAVYKLKEISQQLMCAQDPHKAHSSHNVCHKWEWFMYSQPVLLQHYPMYRLSDANCDTVDAASPKEKTIPFRPKWDCLSEESSNQLFDLINPRLIISAHTHHGCYRRHENGVPEWTIASFSWRNKKNPTFLLMKINNNDFSLTRCSMPNELTVIGLYVIGGIFIVFSLLLPRRIVKFSSDKAH